MRRIPLALALLGLVGVVGCYCSPQTHADAPGNRVGRSVPGAPAIDGAVFAADPMPFNPQERQGEAVIRRDQQFEDIPTPLGFTLKRDKIFAFQGSAYRYGKFIYEGAWTYRKTREFYLSQMPVHEWELVRVNDRYPPDGEIQRYKRGFELAEITLRRQERTVLVEVVVRDAGRPDPMVLAAARANAASAAPGSVEVAAIRAGDPYAPIYLSDPGAGTVAYSGSSTVAVSSAPVVAANPVLPAPAPAYAYGYDASTRPASTMTVANGYYGASVPGAPVVASARPATTPAYTTADAATRPGGAYYYRSDIGRTPGSSMPFTSIQGKAVDPSTFRMDVPPGIGISVR